MKTKYSTASIVRYFQTYANKEMEKYSAFKEIGNFAISLNQKVNQLIKVGNDVKLSDLYDLELTLIQCGKAFVGRFSEQFRTHKQSYNPQHLKKEYLKTEETISENF